MTKKITIEFEGLEIRHIEVHSDRRPGLPLTFYADQLAELAEDAPIKQLAKAVKHTVAKIDKK